MLSKAAFRLPLSWCSRRSFSPQGWPAVGCGSVELGYNGDSAVKIRKLATLATRGTTSQQCGSWAGLFCAEGFYCAYPEAYSCAPDDVAGTCQPRSTICQLPSMILSAVVTVRRIRTLAPRLLTASTSGGMEPASTAARLPSPAGPARLAEAWLRWPAQLDITASSRSPPRARANDVSEAARRIPTGGCATIYDPVLRLRRHDVPERVLGSNYGEERVSTRGNAPEGGPRSGLLQPRADSVPTTFECGKRRGRRKDRIQRNEKGERTNHRARVEVLFLRRPESRAIHDLPRPAAIEGGERGVRDAGGYGGRIHGDRSRPPRARGRRSELVMRLL